jgi:glucosamine--fructose-6-phosphate aminotransferase (isomerizing)
MGFAGTIPEESGVSVVLNGLKKLEYRGYDSSGIAYFAPDEKKIKYIKKSGKLINLFTEVAEIQCKNQCLIDTVNMADANKNRNIRLNTSGASIIQSSLAIGHIRWATHGKPTDDNAHPHLDCSGDIAIVHNGIIENYIQLKEKLLKNNHKFKTETDSEIIAHLIEDHILKGDSFSESVRKTSLELRGSFAIVILYAKEKTIAAVKFGPPLVLAKKGKNLFVASDVSALLEYSNEVIYLKNGEIAYYRYEADDNDNYTNNYTNNDNNNGNCIANDKRNNADNGIINSCNCNKLEIINFRGKKQKIDINAIKWDSSKTVKSGFSHFMQKEIFEQPTTILEGFNSRVLFKKDLRDINNPVIFFGRVPLINSDALTPNSTNLSKSDTLKKGSDDFENVKIALEGLKLTKKDIVSAGRIIFIACGSSYYSSLVIKNVIENLCGLPVIVDYGSEFRYGKFPIQASDIVVGVSQSGETADTNSAIEIVKEKKAKIISICNVPGSQLTTLSNKGVIYTHAGPEIGVASTKAFTSQVLCGILFGLYLRQEIMSACGYTNSNLKVNRFFGDLIALPQRIEEILALNETIKNIANKYYKSTNFLYLGRGILYPIALEGALKLKEISYIHAEGYPSGEMKHGPIALIDENMPVMFLLSNNLLAPKTISNIEEIKARGGRVIALADYDPNIEGLSDLIKIPATSEILSPILFTVPLQLFAYHIAAFKGTDIDQPRNLAKSVTVE